MKAAAVFLLLGTVLVGAADSPVLALNARTPTSDADARFWLENMVWHHRFSNEEILRATGWSNQELLKALGRFDISRQDHPVHSKDAGLLVLPYPGGRHPRIGFLDGAIDPQRETKFSVFLPWDLESYIVVDLPEAIWSNLGLTYLAHTHIDTIWTKRKITLPALEWRRLADGRLESVRELPNGIRFGAKVRPEKNAVRMDLWLSNGTAAQLTDLRVQNCVMLKGAKGFNEQTNDNKIFRAPYVACRSADGQHWIITGWHPLHRTWANPPVPCLHSDPKFPDCDPGETKTLRGWLSFFEGVDIQKELDRIDTTGWREEDR